MPYSFNILLLSSIFLLLTAISSTSAATTIGVTYNPSSSSTLPPPDHVSSVLHSLHVPAVHLLDPTPPDIRAFSYSNISLILSVPNSFIPSFAANRSSATLWLRSHVLPFHPRTRICFISVGADVISSPSSSSDFFDPSTALIPAMQNLYGALRDLGIKTVSVSTTLSFINIMTTSFPPSSADFQEPINQVIIQPLLEFLDETNSSLLVTIFPYMIYRLKFEIPIGFALFREHPFNFRDDTLTGVRYRNLFDMMVDSVVAALAISGHENIPLIVAETGWPSSRGNSSSSNATEPEASEAYAEMYLKGLVSHLRSGLGTPLMKEGVAQVYIYALFDGNDPLMNGNGSSRTGQRWGILFPNMTQKFSINFSGTGRAEGIMGMIVLEVLLVVAVFLLL